MLQGTFCLAGVGGIYQGSPLTSPLHPDSSAPPLHPKAKALHRNRSTFSQFITYTADIYQASAPRGHHGQ